MRYYLSVILFLFPFFVSYSQRTIFNNKSIYVVEEDGCLFFETRLRCSKAAIEGDPEEDSFFIKGKLPLGLKRYTVTGHGYYFQYKKREDIWLEPIPFLGGKGVCQAKTITLSRLELQEIYYESPVFSRWDNWLKRMGLRNSYPPHHVTCVLYGDFANYYVIAHEKNLLKILSVIVSGSQTTVQFDSQYDVLVRTMVGVSQETLGGPVIRQVI